MLSLNVAGAVTITSFISFCAWMLSVLTKNYSIIDRLWSIIPPLYVTILTQLFTQELNLADPLQLWIKYPKLFFMFLLPVLWGVRLTCNFARKGGYSLHNEDYRWSWMRSNVALFKSEFFFQIFNITFISTYQPIILHLLAHPMFLVTHVLARNPSHPIGQLSLLDVLVTFAFLTVLYCEWRADEEQWQYYLQRDELRKSRAKWTDVNKPNHITFPIQVLKQGFNSYGMFSYSRHPNFLSEISLWWIYATYAWKYTTVGTSFYPTWNCLTTGLKCPVDSSLIDFLLHPYSIYTGAFLLWGIFMGSTALTEHISTQKYPQYAQYQKHVPRLIPNPLSVIKALVLDKADNSRDHYNTVVLSGNGQSD